MRTCSGAGESSTSRSSQSQRDGTKVTGSKPDRRVPPAVVAVSTVLYAAVLFLPLWFVFTLTLSMESRGWPAGILYSVPPLAAGASTGFLFGRSRRKTFFRGALAVLVASLAFGLVCALVETSQHLTDDPGWWFRTSSLEVFLIVLAILPSPLTAAGLTAILLRWMEGALERRRMRRAGLPIPVHTTTPMTLRRFIGLTLAVDAVFFFLFWMPLSGTSFHAPYTLAQAKEDAEGCRVLMLRAERKLDYYREIIEAGAPPEQIVEARAEVEQQAARENCPMGAHLVVDFENYTVRCPLHGTPRKPSCFVRGVLLPFAWKRAPELAAGIATAVALTVLFARWRRGKGWRLVHVLALPLYVLPSAIGIYWWVWYSLNPLHIGPK